MTAADNCTADNSGIAPLDTQVAPYLASLKMAATGTLETGPTQETAPFCTHYSESLGASWADAANLANKFGWTFGSATATYPSKRLNSLTPAQAYYQTCGSANAIDAHGLPGAHGIIDYPGAAGTPTQLQTNFGANCFAWGRQYGNNGITQSSAGNTSPYWQYTAATNGGSCNVKSNPCYNTPPSQSGKLPRYTLPSKIISIIKSLQPGQWYTLQSYILVKGRNPAYSSNKSKWNCTSPNSALHWTNDNERYCYSDWKQIVDAIHSMSGITVADPLTIGEDFWRPSSYTWAGP
jgi:hypothetical protein